MSDLVQSTSSSPPPLSHNLFKKKLKKTSSSTQARKRPITETLEDHVNSGPKPSTALPGVVKFSKRTSRRSLNPLYQATGRSQKRLKADGDDHESSSEDDNDDEDDLASRGGVSYQAQGSARQQAAAMIAAQEAKKPLQTDLSPPEPPPADDGLYHGTASSKHQLPKGSAKYGPIKGGPNNIRTITVVDYQPDVCKDYKETGYCGFGDTCKFLHDRSDYMHGWQLDDAFSSRNKSAQAESEEEEEVPFACLICRQPFTDPIVTKCQHYYCSSCAIKRFAKTPKCFACGAPTSGIFNKATRIIEKMKAKQERMRQEKEERRKELDGLAGIEGLEEKKEEEEGSERSFYEDE